MAKFRPRVKGKGKRWPKGQSSSSNPATTKFRDAAKTGFFEPIQDSKLTTAAIIKHDANFSFKSPAPVDDGAMDEDRESSFGAHTYKTFDTFASDWSSCSNQSYTKLMKVFRPDSAMHKDMLAILAAITEVIKEQGGTESNTDYFAALMTSLDAQEMDDSRVAATLTLLSMGIKRVPAPVLQVKFAHSTRTLMNLLAKFVNTEHFHIIRSILGCLSVLLRAQEPAVWGEFYTLQVLDSVLSFIAHTKPKVRKAAHHGVIVIVKTSQITPKGLSHVAKHCVRLLNDVSSGGTTSCLHVLSLLKDIMHTFPKNELKECIEQVLKLMTMNNILLSSCGMQALHGMFVNHPQHLTSERNARMISALYDFQPPPSDTQPSQAWLALLQEAYLNLAKLDLHLCVANLPRLFKTACEMYLCDRVETQTAVTHTLQAALTDCLGPAVELNRNIAETAVIIETLMSCLGYQYHSSWTHILHLFSALFKAVGGKCGDRLGSVLQRLADLRDNDKLVNEVEYAVGSAVSAMGPQAVIKAIPLLIGPNDKKREFKRSWLLPVLKSSIKGSTLKCFIDEFLPLATMCWHEVTRLKKEEDNVGALSYELIQSQLWALLPSFCNLPTDIVSSFPMIAKALGGVISTRKDLRPIVFSSLRKLILQSLAAENEEEVKTLAKYAKNYLPLLFNVYTTTGENSVDEGTRLSAYETIKVYLRIADDQVRCEMYEKALIRMESEETDEFTKANIPDLLRALLPYQSKENMDKMFQKIKAEVMKPKNHKWQKKYYRLLEELFTSESSKCQEFAKENVEGVKQLLIDSMEVAAPSSQGVRLRCILHLFKYLKDPTTTIEAILPETILSLKDINTKCRTTAYKILEAVSELVDPKQYLTSVMSGLTGNPTLISCSILALATIFRHNRDNIDSEIEEDLLHQISLYTVCSTREIVTSSLLFFRVYIQCGERSKVAAFVPKLLQLMLKMDEDCKKHTRTKCRDILAKLIRWFGHEHLLNSIPEDETQMRTRIKNLHKIYTRKKKLKQADSSGQTPISQLSHRSRNKTIEEILADSDSDFDEEDDEEEDKKSKKKSKTWITETAGDIVDFTDVTSTRKITGSNPVKKSDAQQKKPKAKSEFKTAPDGRLIITDLDVSDEEEGDTLGKKKRKKKSAIPGLDDSDEDFAGSDDGGVSEVTHGLKRTLSVSSFGTAASSKYKAGGSGIHRPIAKKKKTESMGGFSGKVYASKKGRGDVKRKGLPDPYAYIPLRRDALNKRKRLKHMTHIKNIIKSAKKGALAGVKMRKK